MISLRANNRYGAGEAVYATAKTTTKDDDDLIADELDEEEDDNQNGLQDTTNQLDDKSANSIQVPNRLSSNNLDNSLDSNVLQSNGAHEIDPKLLPPLGVKAEVLSSNRMRVSWTEQISRHLTSSSTTAIEHKKDQSYMIKFNSLLDKASKGKIKFLNTSDNHILIDDLKPFTKYEFAVKMIKRNRASTWSMSVVNVTGEALPASAPRDLIVQPVSNLIANHLNKFAASNDPMQTNRIAIAVNNDNLNNQIEQDNRLSELASYTGSGSLSKQSTIKKAKSAISRTGKYHNKFKNTKYFEKEHELSENDDDATASAAKLPNSQNYIQEPESEKQQQFKIDSLDNNGLFDKQAIVGLSAVSLRLVKFKKFLK